MSAQTPVGVVPASKTVRRTIEVAVLETTSETVPQIKSGAQTQMRARLIRSLPRLTIKGGISFVGPASVRPGIKIIRIDGRLPGEQGYPLQ